MNILSAVTTCKRPNGVNYLPSTLESLWAAGFAPLIVEDAEFAGSWPNLRRALQRLVERPGSDADALCVFQDDIQVAHGLRAWLEESLWPGPVDQTGVVSLYTASTNHLRPGWFTLDDLPVYRPYGALALCFPRHAAERLLHDPPNLAFRTGSDTSTATFCRKHRLSFWLHSPSLTEHTGIISSIGDHRGTLIPERQAGHFCRDVRDLGLCTAIHEITG